MNTFWLVVFIFSSEGEFLEKSSYEAASKSQCIEMAADEARKIVNTQTQAQFFCVSDDHYTGREQDPGVPYD